MFRAAAVEAIDVRVDDFGNIDPDQMTHLPQTQSQVACALHVLCSSLDFEGKSRFASTYSPTGVPPIEVPEQNRPIPHLTGGLR